MKEKDREVQKKKVIITHVKKKKMNRDFKRL